MLLRKVGVYKIKPQYIRFERIARLGGLDDLGPSIHVIGSDQIADTFIAPPRSVSAGETNTASAKIASGISRSHSTTGAAPVSSPKGQQPMRAV